MNPLRIIRRKSPNITNLESDTGIGFGSSSGVSHNSGDAIPPGNINIFDLFGIGASYFENRSMPWHGKAKSGIENSEGKITFKNAGRKNNFEIVGRKTFMILNHVDSNHINTDLNQINSNHVN